MHYAPLLLSVLQQSVPVPAPIRPEVVPPPNIVVIVADDFGVDQVGAYAEGIDPPCTPNIDGLAAQGLLFRNAWANPSCVPTRASTLTGRHGFRTGIGQPGPGNQLPLQELIIPEFLSNYESAAVGKWHLGGPSDTHPGDSGFDSFAGLLGGGVQSYFSWTKTVDGQNNPSSTYTTTDIANEAISSISTMPEPWFAWVAFNAPHSPFHVPPAGLCPTPTCPSTWCGNVGPGSSNLDLGKAMIEAMDAELGRFLQVLDAVDPGAMVFFIGDNGTARQLSQAPFVPDHAKGSVYEGGVNVPLIVRGPGVRPGECAGLVSCVDLFATVGELAGVPVVTEDSVSMVPYFSNPGLSLRETVYTETFEPNGGTLPFTEHRRAVRDERYKLIRRTNEPDEFYDLLQDPFEVNDLLPNLSRGEQLAYDRLLAELVSLGVD